MLITCRTVSFRHDYYATVNDDVEVFVQINNKERVPPHNMDLRSSQLNVFSLRETTNSLAAGRTESLKN